MVDRLASAGATSPMVYPNGDRVDELPEMQPELRARIDAALSDEVAARFIGP
jgi:hypothetical protein